ncbi:PTB domain-containing engulfment adapter protein 1-like [Sinocyclocheilus grahami]|uniref:PTB domain-containing engulfment adapter protein 1-like n=1 Tax=Sinocyclocheilus grahami TaxID=75366 RepID=UPI0007ACA2F0|nr:PREDICTED: PTB domain-containing engulfment adapter protein 1-like [Sinocyclocheilus grahami]
MRLDGLRFSGNKYKINIPCGFSLESFLSLQALVKLSRMNRAFNRRKDKPSMHTPEALVRSHVVYNAKFLGITEVEQPKGTDMVRVAVRKLKFQRHIKKSEGQKTPKVELQISIYGVKILDPKTKIQDLEMENSKLKKKLKELEDQLMDSRCSPERSKPSALSWSGDDVTSLSSLEISSVTLTPVSSPDSSQSASLLTQPPAKPTHSQPTSGCIVPQPRAGSIQARVPSTDIFDMVPFTPESPITRL